MKTLKMILCLILAAGFVLLSSSCRTTEYYLNTGKDHVDHVFGSDTPHEETGSLKPAPPITPKMKQRAAELKAAINGSKENAVFLYLAGMDFFEEIPQALIQRLDMLGIKKLYLHVPVDEISNEKFALKLHKFLKAMQSRKLQVSLVIKDVSLHATGITSGEYRRRYLLSSSTRLSKVIDALENFNDDADSPEEKFHELSIVLTPHLISSSMPNLPIGTLYCWGNKKYGINNDNDMLIRRSVNILRTFRDSFPNIKVSAITQDYFHDAAKDKKLSVGTTTQLLKYSNTVLVTSFYDNDKDIFNKIERELKETSAPQSIIIRIMTAPAVYGEKAKKSLSRKKWPYFINALKNFNNKCTKYPSYKGIAFDSFEGLERILER
jgi:hypothetical protein